MHMYNLTFTRNFTPSSKLNVCMYAESKLRITLRKCKKEFGSRMSFNLALLFDLTFILMHRDILHLKQVCTASIQLLCRDSLVVCAPMCYCLNK